MTSAAPAVLNPWTQLSSYISEWFYKPDFAALECILSAVVAHRDFASPPVWIFLIGPSSSGKTRIAISPLDQLEDIHPQGDITPRTFISFYQKVGGLLTEVGKSGILTFKDFTTILSKRDDDRMEIASQLREIYDGKFIRRSGTNMSFGWEGKITVLAACTPAIERFWGLKRELGERFLTVRWNSACDRQGLRESARQRGRDPEISLELEKRTKACLAAARPGPLSSLTDDQENEIAGYAELLATMRGTIQRESSNSRKIIEMPAIEDGYRVHKALSTLAAGHASLWNRQPDNRDLDIARKAAMDSIPQTRRAVLSCFFSGAKLGVAEIRKSTKLPSSTIEWTLEEMGALGVVSENRDPGENPEFELTDKFSNLLDEINR